MSLQFSATDIKKVFNRRTIFHDVSFSVKSGQTLLVTGRNGSGKSTLVKILSDVLSPTEGSVKLLTDENKEIISRTRVLGLVSPYLQMYDEFSAEENLQYALSIRGALPDSKQTERLLKKVFLFNRKADPVRTFSSGMKQRMKYAFALIHQPEVLILDEPTANLDIDGIAMVKEIMHEHQKTGILVVATNDMTDVDHFHYQVNLNAAN